MINQRVKGDFGPKNYLFKKKGQKHAAKDEFSHWTPHQHQSAM